MISETIKEELRTIRNFSDPFNDFNLQVRDMEFYKTVCNFRQQMWEIFQNKTEMFTRCQIVVITIYRKVHWSRPVPEGTDWILQFQFGVVNIEIYLKRSNFSIYLILKGTRGKYQVFCFVSFHLFLLYDRGCLWYIESKVQLG